MIVPIKIPPGVYRNGTEYQSMGRWFDSALVRWRSGTMGPVGGWSLWSAEAISGIARGIQPWRSNAGDRWLAVGTASHLYVYNADGDRFDITPAGFTAGNVDAEHNTGYGSGLYGESPYGTARSDMGVIEPASTWALDTWGEYLVGCMNADGKLYEWTLFTGTPAQAITNAPTGCRSLVVTAERFLLALGSGGNPRLIQWCDQEDNTDWTPGATNQAGSVEIQTRGEIVCGRRTRNETLILTTTDLHSAVYLGPPYIYGFTKLGDGCGVAAANGVAVFDNRAAWLGERGFYVYDGYVKRLESDVVDYFFANISSSQISKTCAFLNSAYDEIWWVYPSEVENECDSYVAWNYVENHWSIGPFARSAASDRVIFDRPMLVGTDGYIYEHETGNDHDDIAVFAESGPLEIAAGERVASLRYMYPDEATLGSVTATFIGRMYPTAAETEYGPYTMANPTSLRLTARQIRMRVEAVGSDDWRVGIPRVDVVAGGQR